MAGETARSKGKSPAEQKTHSTRQSRHQEAEHVYQRQADLDIDASRHVVKRRVKNKT